MEKNDPPQDPIGQLGRRISYLEFVLREQTKRLYEIERRLGLDPQLPAPGPEVEPLPPRRQGPPRREQSHADEVRRPPSAPAAPESAPAEPTVIGSPRLEAPVLDRSEPVQQSVWAPDLESRIGGNWFNRIGIVAIIIGVGFFLKYAFDNQWIGPWGRVLIGAAAGFGFLIGGERLRGKGYRSYGHGLSGGGISILYLAVFAAYDFYSLISQPVAFAAMALVTAGAVFLAARYSALAIAVLALIGGFLTPILLSTGVDNQTGLFGYLVVLDSGVLALAYRKNWRSLNYLAFGATTFMFAGWFEEWYEPEKLGLTLLFLTLFFLIFLSVSIAYSVRRDVSESWGDVVLMVAASIAYFSVTVAIIGPSFSHFQGGFTASLGVLHVLLALVLSARDRGSQLVTDASLVLGIVFLFLAVPIQFDGHRVTILWSLEAAVLTFLSAKFGRTAGAAVGFVIFVAAGLSWIVSLGITRRAIPVFNWSTLSGAVVVAALAVSAKILKPASDADKDAASSVLSGLCLLGANLLALALITLEVITYFSPANRGLDIRSGEWSQGLEIQRHILEGTKSLALTIAWGVYGAIVVFVGFWRGRNLLRLGGLALLGITSVKLFATDLGYYDAIWRWPILNPTFVGFMFVGLILVLILRAYGQAPDVDENEKNSITPLLVIAANLIVITALSAEASGYFAARRRLGGFTLEEMRALRLAQALALSMVWMVYGGAMLAVGIMRNSKIPRVSALILLTFTILKVFFFDLAFLESIYRIVSFIVLGAVLLIVSFLYQRLKRRTGVPNMQER